MATFNQIPKSAFYSRRADGRGSLDSAALWTSLAQRTAAIEQGLLRVGGWAQGDAAVITGAQTVHLGDFLLPAPARPTSGALRVWVYVTRTSGAVTYSAQLVASADGAPMRPLPVVGASASRVVDAGGGVAFGLDLDTGDLLASSGALDCAIRVTAAGEPGADHAVESIAVIARPDATVDGATPPTAWPVTSIAQAGDDNTPDAVATLRRLRDGQAALAGRAPRVLACRTLGTGHVVPPGFDTSVFSLFAPRGIESGDVEVAFWAKQTTGPGLTYDVAAYDFDEETGAVTGGSVVASGTVTDPSGAWHLETIPASEWDASAMKFVQIGFGSASGTGAGEVRAIVLTEDEYDAAGYLVGGETMPDGPLSPAVSPGSPIVADLVGDAGVDRRTLAATVAWQGWARSQVLAIDSPYAEVSAAGTSAAGTDTSADALWYGRHRLSLGSGGLEVWALVERVGATNPSRWPRLTLAVDGVATEAVAYVPEPPRRAAPDERGAMWLRLPTIAGDAGSTYELELWGGWYDSDGLTPASGGSESLRLLGVALRETPASST